MVGTCAKVDRVGGMRVGMCVCLCKCVSKLCSRIHVIEWIELVV